MISDIREHYNSAFKPEHYQKLQEMVVSSFGEPCPFRISETPVFIPRELKEKIFEACDALIAQLDDMDYEAIRTRFMPKELNATKPKENPHFLGIDFGLCEEESGEINPKLIELQAFPSLYCYQLFLGNAMRASYPGIPQNGFQFLLGGLDEKAYLERLKEVIIKNADPENVVLMEIQPDKQKTRIDFHFTREMLGIETVCITEIIRRGRDLFYKKGNREIPIKRIYNRLIYDDLKLLPELRPAFGLFDDLEVEWVTHPDWFFTVSKCIMPKLVHESVPPSYYLQEAPDDLDLSKYVLKPLFSFAGRGININPTREILDEIGDKGNFILQRKVKYSPLIVTPAPNNSRVEIRMLYLINPATKKMEPVINLVRMGKEGLINVSHQTKDTWIGSSIAFFED